MKNQFHSRARKAAFLVAVIALASAVSVYAYYALLPPQKGPVALITSPPIEFSMELNKAEFASGENVTAPGENVTVRLSLKNVSNKTITVEWGNYYGEFDKLMYFDFYVLDANNTRVFQWTNWHFHLNAVLTETVDPDEKLVSVYTWYQEWEYGGWDYVPVPKGTYHIVGLTRAMLLTVDEQRSVIALETPSITITIK